MTDQAGVTIIRSKDIATPAASADPPAEPAKSAFLQHVPTMLLIFLCLTVLVYVGLLGFYTIPEKNMQAFTEAGGLIVAAFLTVCNFFFGSSRSSSAKDDVIAKQLSAKGP